MTETTQTGVNPTGIDLTFAHIGKRVTVTQRTISDDKNIRDITVTGTLMNIGLEANGKYRSSLRREVRRVIAYLGDNAYYLTPYDYAKPLNVYDGNDWILAAVDD